jgi:DNA-binding transcriptional LysR family regulator
MLGFRGLLHRIKLPLIQKCEGLDERKQEIEMLQPGQGSAKVSRIPTDFTVHQLKIFHTVARQLSYTRAAEILYLSQPAVTQQIRSLERMVGHVLFARRGRGIILTAAGSALLHYVERILLLLDETASVVEEITTLKRGSVVIGASTSAGTYVVPPMLSSFHARYPQIHVTLIVANRHTIEELLLAHQIDLAILSIVEQQDRFLVGLLQPYELVVVASSTHRLAKRANIAMRELEEETLLLSEPGAGTRLDTEQRFAQEGIALPGHLELNSIEAIKEGVIAGLGIAVVSRESIELELSSGDLVILDVQGFPLRREWHIVTLKNRHVSYAAVELHQFLLFSRRDPTEE